MGLGFLGWGGVVLVFGVGVGGSLVFWSSVVCLWFLVFGHWGVVLGLCSLVLGLWFLVFDSLIFAGFCCFSLFFSEKTYFHGFLQFKNIIFLKSAKNAVLL